MLYTTKSQSFSVLSCCQAGFFIDELIKPDVQPNSGFVHERICLLRICLFKHGYSLILVLCMKRILFFTNGLGRMLEIKYRALNINMVLEADFDFSTHARNQIKL